MVKKIVLLSSLLLTMFLLSTQSYAAVPVHQTYYDTGTFSGEVRYNAGSSSSYNKYDWLESTNDWWGTVNAYKVIYTTPAPVYSDALYDIRLDITGINRSYVYDGSPTFIIQGQESGQSTWVNLSSFFLYERDFHENTGNYSLTLSKGYKYIRIVIMETEKTNHRYDEAYLQVSVQNMKLDICRYQGASAADIAAVNSSLTAISNTLNDVKQQTLRIDTMSQEISRINSELTNVYKELSLLKEKSYPINVIRGNSVYEIIYGELVSTPITVNNGDAQLTVTSTAGSGYTEISGKINTTDKKYKLNLGGGKFLLFKVISPPTSTHTATVNFRS